ncbi:MAG: SCO family protein [Alphaproteobacteria bacterium]|nr:SCO family protein [Alphaproteobacteria bacterium]
MSALAAVLAAAVVLLSWSGVGKAVAPSGGGWGDGSEFAFQPHPGAQLPLHLDFIDEAGRKANIAQFFAGKPVVLMLDYPRCKTLCGLGLANLVAALDALPLAVGRDFQTVVISIDPRDQPADVAIAKAKALAAYHHPGADVGWHFLTGRPEAVREVADTIGFPFRHDAELDQYIHPAGFVVAEPSGRVGSYLLGIDTQPAELLAALTNAAQGRTVGLVTRLLLLCHGKGAPLGRYSLAIEGAFVAANLAAIAGAAAVFAAIWRRRHG